MAVKKNKQGTGAQAISKVTRRRLLHTIVLLLAVTIVSVIFINISDDNAQLKLTLSPQHNTFIDSEYATFTATLHNGTDKPVSTPFGTCAETSKIYIDGVQVYKADAAVCLIGYGTLSPGKNRVTTKVLDISRLSIGKHTITYVTSWPGAITDADRGALKTTIEFQLKHDGRQLDCRSYSNAAAPRCDQLVAGLTVHEGATPKTYIRCEHLRSAIAKAGFSTVSSISTGTCVGAEDPQFVINVPKKLTLPVLSANLYSLSKNPNFYVYKRNVVDDSRYTKAWKTYINSSRGLEL